MAAASAGSSSRRLASRGGDHETACELARTVAATAVGRGNPRHECRAGLIAATADARAGREIDGASVEALIARFIPLSGPEGWRDLALAVRGRQLGGLVAQIRAAGRGPGRRRRPPPRHRSRPGCHRCPPPARPMAPLIANRLQTPSGTVALTAHRGGDMTTTDMSTPEIDEAAPSSSWARHWGTWPVTVHPPAPPTLNLVRRCSNDSSV